MTSIPYRKADVDGLNVFYREAGRADAPALLLLHGFPSAGHMFRDLIPLLTDASDWCAGSARVWPVRHAGAGKLCLYVRHIAAGDRPLH